MFFSIYISPSFCWSRVMCSSLHQPHQMWDLKEVPPDMADVAMRKNEEHC